MKASAFQSADPREVVAGVMRHLYARGMTTASGGNVSVRDGAGRIWITPAGVDKGGLGPGDVVCVECAGEVRAGGLRPSSELPLHAHVYRARADVGAIVHAHAVAAVAFSLCGTAPDLSLLPAAQRMCGRVGVAPYATTGTERLGEVVAEVFARGADCVIMENHGVVTVGANAGEARRRLEMLETAALVLVHARALGGGDAGEERRSVDGERVAATGAAGGAVQVGGVGEHGGGRTAARATVDEVCALAQRAYRRRLLAPGHGSFSARLDGEEFVATPAGADWAELEAKDLVRVALGDPDREHVVHALLYAAHPSIDAVIEAMPVHATAFGVAAGASLETRTIPESYVLLRDVAVVAREALGVEPARLSPRRPVALLACEGAIVLGASPFEALDRLEVLDATAASLLTARVIGEISPLDDTATNALDALFRGENG